MAVSDIKGAAVVRVTLDWREGRHWDRAGQSVCRICGCLTHMRDSAGAAVCKRCVEGEIEAQVLAFARDLIAQTSAGKEPPHGA